MTTLLLTAGVFISSFSPDATLFRGGQLTLEEEAQVFADAWQAKEAETLGAGLASDGILLHIPDEKHNRLNPRQAQAALAAFLGRYPAGETVVTRVSRVEPDEDRGFVEIRWRTGSPGAVEPVIFTVFVAYASLGDSWEVTEIRVLF